MSANAETLAQFGFNTSEAYLLNRYSPEQRRIYLRRELETHVNHTIEDMVVSLPYYYQRTPNGEIISYPSGIPLFIDNEERSGLFGIGVHCAIDSAMANPQKLVFLYSPPGPVAFDDNPENKYRNFKPYGSGQLNMMFFDGEKINNISTMVSTVKGENWVAKILADQYVQTGKTSEIERISYFITHPKQSDFTIDDFLNFSWQNQEEVIFKNVHDREFTLAQTLKFIADSISGRLKLGVNTFDKTIAALEDYEITEAFIKQLYISTIHYYMEKNNLSVLPLGGGCGGTVVKHSSLFETISNLSSPYRLLTQSDEKKHWDYHEGYCVVCDKEKRQKKLVGPCNICKECENKFD